MIHRDRTGERTWRAWLGMGDCSSMTQLDTAEFATAAAARSWVERRLASVAAVSPAGYAAPPGAGPGVSVFGSIDQGRYVGAYWEPDPLPGLDAELVDGRIRWCRPGH